MTSLAELLRADFGPEFPVASGNATRREPLVITATKDYAAIEHRVARLCLHAEGCEYELETQALHEIDGRKVDELVFATRPPGAQDWTHTRRFFFDITLGYDALP